MAQSNTQNRTRGSSEGRLKKEVFKLAFEAETKNIHDAMIAVMVPGIVKSVNEAVAAGMDPNDIINTMGDAMSEVGVMFERGKLFLPHVLSAAAGMTKAMEILTPLMQNESGSTEKKASVVMGTVEGDVHDIGKSICSTMLQCAGYDIHDLGRDVPKQKFIDEVKGGCTYCGMSALMTTTMTVMKEVIDMLEAEGVRGNVKVLVGGAPITQGYADKIGADIYGESASETTRKVKATS
ncbi:MAG: corrinoid protein [Candidatus Methanomethylophilaceae archaeon]|nr:corrinoid protein [Candidatus Methanomethylophilaceae archaeon]